MLIALNSPAPQSGKSTVAQHLVDHHGFVALKFAAPLKDMVRVLLNKHCGISEEMTERYVDGDLKELVIPELGVTCRKLQQELGTRWGREGVRQDLWTHLIRLSVDHWRRQGRDIVVDDMRFLNEYTTVLEMVGTPVRVRRPGVVSKTDHVSEGQLDHMIMRELVNDGSIEELHLDVDRLVADLRAH